MSLTPLPVSPSLTVPMGSFCDMLNTFATPVLELKGRKPDYLIAADGGRALFSE